MKGGCMNWGLGIVVALVAALWLFWTFRYPTYSYNFRMTVAIETPDGVKSGSSVYSVSAGGRPKLTAEEASRSMAVKGEAVAVDLPDGKTLFALLKTNAHFGDMSGLSMTALDPTFKSSRYDTVGTARRISERIGVKESAEVSLSDYPILVTFANINDPKSIERVESADLAATFGDQVKFKSIVVEITDDPVTTGLKKRFSWWSDVKGSFVRFDLQNRPPAGTELPVGTRITKTAFSAAVDK